MADPFVAEIRIFPFNFAPKGWAWCNGQILPISQNTALFSLLGTTYGGDGKSTFALPDLTGRVPIHPGQGSGLSLYDLGQTGGVENVSLLESEIPIHNHNLLGNMNGAESFDPSGNSLANADNAIYSQNGLNNTKLEARTLASAGGGVPHNNLMPYLTFYFNIALQGVFPPRS